MTISPAINLLRRSHRARWFFGGCLVLTLAFATAFLTHDIIRANDASITTRAILAAHTLHWGTWCGLLALVFVLRERLRAALSAARSVRIGIDVVLIAGYAALAVPLTRFVLTTTVGQPPLPDGVTIDSLTPMLVTRAVLSYAVVLLGRACLLGYLRSRDLEHEVRRQALHEELLEAQLRAARSDALRAQLHPHFLFNSLHAIGGMVMEGRSSESQRAIAALATLLRKSFRHHDGPTAPVEDEIELVRNYLALEKIRLGDRLDHRIRVAEGVGEAELPVLILFPIVENSIRHGIAPRPEGGTVSISVEGDGDRLEVLVEDDGKGIERREDTASESNGVGLSNCRERLRALYGGEASMRIASRPPHGTGVHITLPRRIRRLARPGETPA